jgi:hypothetical protein
VRGALPGLRRGELGLARLELSESLLQLLALGGDGGQLLVVGVPLAEAGEGDAGAGGLVADVGVGVVVAPLEELPDGQLLGGRSWAGGCGGHEFGCPFFGEAEEVLAGCFGAALGVDLVEEGAEGGDGHRLASLCAMAGGTG